MSEQKDYVAFGSERHAQLLGLRKATKEDAEDATYKGYALVDPTAWGPNARPEFIRAQLVQRVSELTTAPKVPADALPMWKPTNE